MVFFEKECLPTPSAKSRVWEGKKKWGKSIDKNITNQIEIIRWRVTEKHYFIAYTTT